MQKKYTLDLVGGIDACSIHETPLAEETLAHSASHPGHEALDRPIGLVGHG
jgi:hypothetical protein